MVGLVTHSVEVTWLLDDITMRGTLTVPAGDGRFPAVVMVAGSRPALAAPVAIQAFPSARRS